MFYDENDPTGVNAAWSRMMQREAAEREREREEEANRLRSYKNYIHDLENRIKKLEDEYAKDIEKLKIDASAKTLALAQMAHEMAKEATGMKAMRLTSARNVEERKKFFEEILPAAREAAKDMIEHGEDPGLVAIDRVNKGSAVVSINAHYEIELERRRKIVEKDYRELLDYFRKIKPHLDGSGNDYLIKRMVNYTSVFNYYSLLEMEQEGLKIPYVKHPIDAHTSRAVIDYVRRRSEDYREDYEKYAQIREKLGRISGGNHGHAAR